MRDSILWFIRATMSRKTFGLNVRMNLLKASHGLQYIQPAKAERTMLMSSQNFSGTVNREMTAGRRLTKLGH